MIPRSHFKRYKDTKLPGEYLINTTNKKLCPVLASTKFILRRSTFPLHSKAVTNYLGKKCVTHEDVTSDTSNFF